jgi:hypothetical protein
MVRGIVVGLAFGLCVSLGSNLALADASPPSNGELAREMLAEILAPILERAEAEARGAEVALLPRGAALAEAEEFTRVVGIAFDERGFRIRTLASGDPLPESGLLLDFQLDRASFDYPERREGFLSIGGSQTLRRAALGFTGRLEDSELGRWLWRGSPEIRRQDWVATDLLPTLRSDEPAWMRGTAIPPESRGSRWWERAMVVGLLTGVVVLYFSGVN